MKKINAIVLSILVTGGIFSSSSVFAKSNITEKAAEKPNEESTQKVDSTDFVKFSGVISKVSESDKTLSLTVKKSNDDLIMIFPITDEVLLFGSGSTESIQKETLKEGIQVEVYYDKNILMTMIYPATITPRIIVVKEEGKMGEVKISKFDKNLLSLDNQLKLSLDNDTVLVNEKDEEILETGLNGKELVVFYTISTMSLPAQTAPTKIIALENINVQMKEVHLIIEEDHYTKNGTKMIPIRKVLETLGFKVEWLSKTDSVSVSKQNQTLLVSIGEEKYGNLKYFEVAPEIIKGKTYVPEEFLEMLN